MKSNHGSYIRSYVRRQGKMTKAQRDALERLHSVYCLPWQDGTEIDLGRVFPGKERVILEIGFGMGTTTAIIAEAHPEIGYLGVEVHTPGVGKLLWEIEKRGIENLRIVHDDAIPLLSSGLPQESLDGIHVFFPDPWPKKKHHKRRLISPSFARILASRLKVGGYLYLVTDWEDYAIRMLEVLSQVPELRNPHDGYAPPQLWRPETSFEGKGKKANRPIRELVFTKSTNSSS